MKLKLFTGLPPNGRCLLLAQKLKEATSLPATECVRLAERLFASVHKKDNPAVVEVSEPRMAEELRALCEQFGISIESVPD